MDHKNIIQILEQSLPLIFRRNDLDKLTGGVITNGFLKRLPKDAPKPSGARFGKFVVFEKKQFLKWAEEYYGNFTEYNTYNFGGKKIRRNSGEKGEAGGRSERA